MKRNHLKYCSFFASQARIPPANFKGTKRTSLILLAWNQIEVYFRVFFLFFFWYGFLPSLTKENPKGWAWYKLKGLLWMTTSDMSIFWRSLDICQWISTSYKNSMYHWSCWFYRFRSNILYSNRANKNRSLTQVYKWIKFAYIWLFCTTVSFTSFNEMQRKMQKIIV